MNLKAKWLWTPELGWQKNAQLECENGLWTQLCQADDAPNRILFPAWCNAHAHLELSSLVGKLKPAQDFSKWVMELRSHTSEWSDLDWRESFRLGQEMCLRHGTAAVLDLGNSGANLRVEPQLHLWAQFEVMGLNADLAQERLQASLDALASSKAHPLRKIARAPHAPFSTSSEILKALQPEMPWTIHVDESAEECAFFDHGTGGLAEMAHFLAPKAKWPKGQGRGLRLLLDQGLVPSGALLVHANHSSAKDLADAANLDASLVHCPQSREFFQHQLPNFSLWKKSGIEICLGTDSLASSPSLSQWDELALFLDTCEDVYTLDDGLRALSINPAKALGMAGKLASLMPGAFANWQFVELPAEVENPWEWISTQKIKPAQVGLAGQVLRKDPSI